MVDRKCSDGMGLLLVLATVGLGGGCETGVAPLAGSGAGAPVPATADDESLVRVSFVNETDTVVETQFYVLPQGAGATVDQLMLPNNLVTEGVGVAGTGLLIPLTADHIEVACEDGLTLGVAGGRFLDPDTGEERGRGPARVVQQGLVFDCGAEIVFTYKAQGGGYTVVVDHQ